MPTTLAAVGVCCAVLGFLAWIGYGAFATQGILASMSRQWEVAHRMFEYAGAFRLAQLPLGVLSVGLGFAAKATGEDSMLARKLGILAVGLGIAVLALLFVWV